MVKKVEKAHYFLVTRPSKNERDRQSLTHNSHLPDELFIPPGKQQLKGCQLLCVQMLLLLPIEFQVRFVCEDGFDEFLQNIKEHSR